MITMVKRKSKNVSIVGSGLVALDIVLNGNPKTPPKFFAGGSCGNVLTILSYLGLETHPIARLAMNKATEKLVTDIKRWGVKTDLLIKKNDGSTPIIIQRIKYGVDGNPTHKFEFKNPETGSYLPSYKPVRADSVESIVRKKETCDFYYFDRLSRSTIDFARSYKSKGAIVIFEPSSLKKDNLRLFKECIDIIDVIKFSNERIPSYKRDFPNSGIPLEIETLGKDGINYRFKQNSWHHLPSYKLSFIKDSAGAGDWCTAGIIKGLSKKTNRSIKSITPKELESILALGQALGTLSCLYSGARGMMYNLEAKTSIRQGRLLVDKQVMKSEEILKYSKASQTRSRRISISSLL